MKFRKKPVVIDAIQWTGFNEGVIMDFTRSCTQPIEEESLIIPTLEGNMTAHINDWIIKGVNGEFYPCKPDIFAKTYETPELPLNTGEQEGWIRVEKLWEWIEKSFAVGFLNADHIAPLMDTIPAELKWKWERCADFLLSHGCPPKPPKTTTP